MFWFRSTSLNLVWTRGQRDVSEVLLLPFTADQRRTCVSVLSGSVLGAEGLGDLPVWDLLRDPPVSHGLLALPRSLAWWAWNCHAEFICCGSSKAKPDQIKIKGVKE